MKRLLLIASLVVALVGCADTPQNRELWQGIASGMNSAADAQNKRTESIRESLRQQAAQPVQQPRQTNCTTSYNSLFKQYETVCN